MIEKANPKTGYVDADDNPNACVYAGMYNMVTDRIDIWSHSCYAVAPSNAL